MRPKILVLYCNAGGGSVGYARAGFDVLGVDILPQPRNPAYWTRSQKAAHGVDGADFQFLQGDALEVMASLDVQQFDALHGSPPCQAYSWAAARWHDVGRADLLAPTRDAFLAAGLPYVIENVPGAPVIRERSVTLCGLSFDITGAGLHNGQWPEVLRHRHFETNWGLTAPKHAKHIPGGVPQGLYCTVAGHGGENAKGKGGRTHKQRAMGIDWMNDRELNEAIPPQYLTHVGGQLAALLGGFRKTHSVAAFNAAKAGATRRWNLAEISGEDFGTGRAWVSASGQTGFMVSADGELVNLFNHGAPGEGRRAVRLAVACGARHLNCYDGFLTQYYRQLGFVETGRVAFDDRYAPATWTESVGRPDVVFMALPDAPSTVVAKAPNGKPLVATQEEA